MMKVGIIRGLMPRTTQAELAASFSRTKPVFITGEADDEIKDYCKQANLEQRDLSLKPLFILDPIELFLKKRRHQSWVEVDSLEKACLDIDVLETYELYHFFSGQAAKVARALKIPLICEVWTSFLHPAYKLPPYSLTVRNVIDTTSLFVARSHKAESALLELGVPSNKIVVIYHGVDISRFQKRNKDRKKEIKVLFVGALDKNKGVEMLLKIWSEVINRYPNAKLTLVGKGSLERKAKQVLGVEVIGYIHHDKLPKIYQDADLFISPSQDRYIGPVLWWEEFFSYALMDAQAAGLPIVATRSGGIPEEIGNWNWLVPQRDPQALLTAILNALSNDKKRSFVGRKNRERAEKLFDLRKQTRILENLILKLA